MNRMLTNRTIFWLHDTHKSNKCSTSPCLLIYHHQLVMSQQNSVFGCHKHWLSRTITKMTWKNFSHPVTGHFITRHLKMRPIQKSYHLRSCHMLQTNHTRSPFISCCLIKLQSKKQSFTYGFNHIGSFQTFHLLESRSNRVRLSQEQLTHIRNQVPNQRRTDCQCLYITQRNNHNFSSFFTSMIVESFINTAIDVSIVLLNQHIEWLATFGNHTRIRIKKGFSNTTENLTAFSDCFLNLLSSTTRGIISFILLMRESA